MKVTIIENSMLDDIDVVITCPKLDERLQRVIATLSAFDRKLIGSRNGSSYRIDLEKACYAETVDGKTFIYTTDEVFETPMRLSELEAHLEGTEFVRASKQMLVNFDHVTSIRPVPNARLQLTLDNKEKVIVSRQYAPAFKRKLGL